MDFVTVTNKRREYDSEDKTIVKLQYKIAILERELQNYQKININQRKTIEEQNTQIQQLNDIINSGTYVFTFRNEEEKL